MAKKEFKIGPGRDSAIELSYVYESNGNRIVWDLTTEELKDLLILLKNSTGLLEEEKPRIVIDLDMGRHILMAAKMNKGYLEMYQAGIIKYAELVEGIIEMEQELPDFDEKGYREWLDEQEKNILPNWSSGSFMSALTDWDNLFLEHWRFQAPSVEKELDKLHKKLFPKNYETATAAPPHK